MKTIKKMRLLAIASIFSSTIQAQTPSYYWSMEDVHVSGTSNIMTLSGGSYQRPGKIGRAYFFKSHPQAPVMYGTLNVAKTTGISLSPNGVYSVSCWFNTSTYPEFYPNNTENYIISKMDGKKEMCLLLKKGGRLTFRSWYRNDAYDEMSSPDTIPLNRWVHATVTVDWNNKMERLYVNGIEKSHKTLTGKPQYVSGGSPVYFANKAIWSPGSGEVVPQFNGAIDEIKIYNDRILNTDFIMTESSVNLEPDHCWTFNEDWYVNNRLKDFYGFNDLTLTGNIQFVPGKIGATAMLFSQNGQYATTKKNVVISNNGNYCVSGWIYPTNSNGGIIGCTKQNGGTANDFNIRLSNGKIKVTIWGYGGNSSMSMTGGNVSLNTWSNFLFQINNKNKQCTLYINGKSVMNMTLSFTPNMTPNKLIIGNVDNTSFSGMIDDISFYRNRVLSSSDISWIANKTELKDKTYAPLYIEYHGQTSHRQVGYEPKFIAASEFSFDSKNRPYNRNIDYVQYLDEEGNWQRSYLKDYIKGTIHSNSWQDDNRVVFDNDDWAYTLVRIGNKGLILYSQDYCRTWKVLDLGVEAWSPSWEIRTVNDNLSDPPLLMVKEKLTYNTKLNDTLNSNQLYLLFFKKDGNILKLAKNLPLGLNGDTNVHHSGGGSQIVSTKDNVYITYSKQIGDGTYTPIYARTINKHNYETVGNETLLGKMGTSYDGHNFASIVMDKSGYLHAVITGHHHQIQYTRSKNPYSTNSWEQTTTPINGNATYGALVIDNNDKLHLITRYDVGYTFSLSEATKESNGSWSAEKVIVSPRVDNYFVPTHHLVIDRKGNAYMTCAYWRTQSGIYSEMKSYQAEWSELNINITNMGANQYGVINNAPFFQAETFILPVGETRWRLATTDDFLENLNNEGNSQLKAKGSFAKDEREIGIDHDFTNADKDESCTVYNMKGQIILKGNINDFYSLSDKKGIYIIKTKDSIKKIIF
jgi:hypothetical protein